MRLLTYLLGRLTEPSSWAGIYILSGVSMPADERELITQAGTALAGLAAFLLAERRRNTTTGEKP